MEGRVVSDGLLRLFESGRSVDVEAAAAIDWPDSTIAHRLIRCVMMEGDFTVRMLLVD